MATAQKRGFRLPWGGGRDEPPPDGRADGDAEATELARRLGAARDDLGKGPFALPPTAPAAKPEAEGNAATEEDEGTGEQNTEAVATSDAGPADVEAGPVDEIPADRLEAVTEGTRASSPKAGRDVPGLARMRTAWPESDRRTAGPLAASANRTATRVAEPIPEADASTDVDERPEDASVEAEESTEVEGSVEAEESTEAGGSVEAEGSTEVEGSVEAEGSTEGEESTVQHVSVLETTGGRNGRSAEAWQAPRQRRDNPLVVGLVRAMREAAQTARDEALTTLHDEVAASEEAIKTRSADATSELRQEAEADVASIKEWSRAELARVREETERRIEARKAQLVDETEAEANAVQHRMGSLHATVEAFEAEMATFFEALLAEEDPARLAALAEQMPAPPALFPGPADTAEFDETTEPEVVALVAAPDSAQGGAVEGLEAAGVEAEEAEPEAHAGPEAVAEPEGAAEAEVVAEATEVDAEATEVVGEATKVEDDDTGAPAAREAEGLDADAAAAAEAEALAGLDRHTGLVVSGLSSVASIASFKGALLNVEGVSAVSVTAGQEGEVLFSVTHDGVVDLRAAIGAMETFETQVIADDGTTVSLAAREIAA